MKYRVAHYQKEGSDWYINGGSLILTDFEYVLKNFFKTVVKFEKDNTVISRIPDYMMYKGINMSDGKQSYNLYFFEKNAVDVYHTFEV